MWFIGRICWKIYYAFAETLQFNVFYGRKHCLYSIFKKTFLKKLCEGNTWVDTKHTFLLWPFFVCMHGVQAIPNLTPVFVFLKLSAFSISHFRDWLSGLQDFAEIAVLLNELHFRLFFFQWHCLSCVVRPKVADWLAVWQDYLLHFWSG